MSAAVIGFALLALIGIAATSMSRDDGVALTFDPTVGQRIHLVREYGADPAHDPSDIVHAHVLRENDQK
jgi:hypothetical protein